MARVRAVITDFGLANFVMQDDGALEGGSSFSGTLAYAAPERFLGARATAASDVYSLGLDRRADVDRSPARGRHAAKRALDMANTTLPSEWQALLARAINRDPVLRFPHGASVAEALRKLARRPRSVRAGLAQGGRCRSRCGRRRLWQL